MDYLQEGIGLRAMGQRDPLVEYQREGFDMFSSMMEAIKEESVGFLFNVEVQMTEEPSGEADIEPVEAEVLTSGAVEAEAAADTAAKPAARPQSSKGLDGGARPQGLTYSAPSVDGDGAVVSEGGGTDLGDGLIDATGGKPGRNDPCPCGSGRKYKRCHGDPARRSKV
jgi:preprotein translocase subunit SecA